MHLFAGIGGGLYADLILGHTPVCAIEIDPYCCQVLRERRDEGWFPGLTIHEGDVREFDFSPWSGKVDCIAAGFPCQDISVAGRGVGIEGERSGLWREVVWGIRSLRPRYAFLENSPAITCRGLDVVLGGLASLGYDAEWTVLGAEDIGAGHKRERWWCLAYLDGLREQQSSRSLKDEREWDQYDVSETTDTDSVQLRKQPGWECRKGWTEETTKFERKAEETPNSLFDRLQESVQRGWISETDGEAIQAVARYCGTPSWNPINSDLLRMVYGLPNKGNRIKGLGNAQVPLQAAAAWVILGGPVPW
jgi:DNA (cytosine-5)-methyltransferase 1